MLRLDVLAGLLAFRGAGFDTAGFGHHVRDVLILAGDADIQAAQTARMEGGAEPALVVVASAALQRLLDHVERGGRHVVLGVLLLHRVPHRLTHHLVQLGAVHVGPHAAGDLRHQDHHQEHEELPRKQHIVSFTSMLSGGVRNGSEIGKSHPSSQSHVSAASGPVLTETELDEWIALITGGIAHPRHIRQNICVIVYWI